MGDTLRVILSNSVSAYHELVQFTSIRLQIFCHDENRLFKGRK